MQCKPFHNAAGFSFILFALFSSSPVEAAYVTMNYQAGGGGGYATGTASATYTGVPGANGNYQTGNYRFLRTAGASNAELNQVFVQSNTSGNLWTFCLELNQGLFNPVYFDVRSVESNSAGTGTVMSANQGNAIRQLWYRYHNAVVDAASAAAFQLALWEISFDGGENWGSDGKYIGTTPANLLAEGDVQNRYNNNLESDATKRNLANTWLKSLTDSSGSGWGVSNLARLASIDDQDQVIELNDGWGVGPNGPVAVPVPPAFVLAAAGIASGLLMRRRLGGHKVPVVA
jgi:hypothetical protein